MGWLDKWIMTSAHQVLHSEQHWVNWYVRQTLQNERNDGRPDFTAIKLQALEYYKHSKCRFVVFSSLQSYLTYMNINN